MVGPKSSDQMEADAALFDDWIEQSGWSGEVDDASILVTLAKKYGCAVAVLDDFRIGVDYQRVILAGGLKWLQFEGRADRPLWADWVLSANPAARLEEYARHLHKPGARALLGPKYAILRPEFSSATPRRGEKSRVTDVLVTFGGGDDRGAILFVLKALLPVTETTSRFHVLSGANNPRNPELEQWIESEGGQRTILHVNPARVAPLLSACDLAVMAGGTTTYEAAFCGLPMLLLTIVANQERQSQAWHDKGAAICLGRFNEVSEEDLVSQFSNLSRSPGLRKKMSDCGQREVDGKGAEKIALMLINRTSHNQ